MNRESYIVRRAFADQKGQAKHRGVGFDLSFEQWCDFWEPYWETRTSLDLVMARFGDVGPYATGNIYVTTRGQNCRDRFKPQVKPCRL